MTIDETFNPVIHRVNQAICKKAVLPDSKVDDPAEILMKWSNPPEALVEQAMPNLEKLIKVAKLQKGTHDYPLNSQNFRNMLTCSSTTKG